MTRLRILVCAFSCHPTGGSGLGSGEDILGWNLVRQIVRHHDAWVLTYVENRPGIEDGLKDDPMPGAHFHYIDLPSWARPLLRLKGGHQLYAYLWQIKAYFVARSLNRSSPFDLFHHVTYANDWMASFIGALLPVPYVRGPGGGAHRTPQGFEREYSLGGRFWERVRSVGQWVLRRDPFFVKGQHRAHAIMVCNQESLANVPAKWSHKVHQYPVSGISSDDLALSVSKAENDSQFRVLSVGSLIPVKGFGLAIKAFQQFVNKHPDSSLCIIGSGPEEAKLKTTVRNFHLCEKVQFMPAMPREKVLHQMAACDVFIFPSLRDGGGTVVIEAMAVGKPVVCLDTGGPGIHVTEDCGIKIKPDFPSATVSDLANALERLYLDEDLRRRLGKTGRQRAEQLYHWDRLGERLMEIYQPILHREPDN